MMDQVPEPKTIEKIGFAAFFSIAMVAGMQLDLFTPLEKGPMSVEQLAEALGVGATKLTPLLYALVSAGLLSVEEGRFANTSETDYYLVRGKPTYLGGRYAWYTERYHWALQTAETIQSGLAQAKVDYHAMSADELESSLRASHPATLATGRHLVADYDFSSKRHLLDVGGGLGGLALAIATAEPQLRVTVIDLPSVTPVTQHFIEQEGMSERIEVVSGDVVHGPLTGTYDVAVLRAFLDVLSPDNAQRALQNLNQVLEPGSPIYIYAQALDDSRLSPLQSVASNLFFMNIYDEGQAYTYDEYCGWLTEASFTGMERVIRVGGRSLITARKSGSLPKPSTILCTT